MNIRSSISYALYNTSMLTWDFFLTLGNLVRWNIPVGQVVPEGHPGSGGYWPEYMAPQEGDSRSCCPCLNAMANHGIISRDGKGIKLSEMAGYIQAAFNFSPSFCYFACHYTAHLLNKNFDTDVFNLAELNLHNGIEHDASLTRRDASLQPNQALVHPPFVEELFAFATGKDVDGNPLLTVKDLSRILGKRRAESRATNKAYSLSFAHKIFGSANASIIRTVFGGRVDDLRVMLLEERLPQGWEPRVRKPYGLTMFSMNLTVLLMEIGIRERDWTVEAMNHAQVSEEEA